MAYTWACGVCLKAFKTVKGKHWHEKRFGHQTVRLDKESRAQVFGLTRQEVNASIEAG